MIPIGETHDGRADMTNFEMDLFDTRMHTVKTVKDEEDGCCGTSSSNRKRIVKPACLPISILSLLIIALVFLPLFKDEDLESPDKMSLTQSCRTPCSLFVVESIPTGLSLPPPTHDSTWKSWVDIIDNTNEFLDIAALYWNLREDGFPTADKGRAVFDALLRAGKRGVKIRIAQEGNAGLSKNEDSAYLAQNAGAQVRNVNVTRLLGSGVLHTKFMISDMRTIYIGSANMDWKSLTEVKELGVVVRNCSCIAADLYRIFAVYWRLGEEDSRIPPSWPISYRTQYNLRNPMDLPLTGGLHSSLFISSSPTPFNPKGREEDLLAIVGLMKGSKRRVSVAVMDFLPMTIYMKSNSYWSALDTSLRDAAFRGVDVKLLISHWNHTRKATLPFLKSLVDINEGLPFKSGRISVKFFTVPSDEEQKKIPFARVNHNKYMVADDVAYIGTSNWAGDYFISTAGIGFALNSTQISGQLQSVFDRDWNSPYADSI